MPQLDATFCCITYPDGMGHNTMAKSLFEAAANALHWAEVDCQTFNSARRYRDDQVLEIGVGMVPDRWFKVRIGRIRRWVILFRRQGKNRLILA
jgi:hypothetical protein